MRTLVSLLLPLVTLLRMAAVSLSVHRPCFRRKDTQVARLRALLNRPNPYGTHPVSAPGKCHDSIPGSSLPHGDGLDELRGELTPLIRQWLAQQGQAVR